MTYEEFKEKVGSVILTDDGNCPVTPVVQMLQGKWKLQILYELCIKCPMRFGELKKVLKPITNTALTNALKELEADELVQRIQYNEMPLRVEYSLTEKGRDLLRLQTPPRLTPHGTQSGEADPCYRPAWPRS